VGSTIIDFLAHFSHRQFAGEGLKALVPRVFGQGARADKKRPGGRHEERQWDEPTFFRELEARRGRDEAAVAKRILEWATPL